MNKLSRLLVFFVALIIFGMLTQVWAGSEKTGENPVYNLVGNYERSAYPFFKKP